VTTNEIFERRSWKKREQQKDEMQSEEEKRVLL
jgi:hypothetical protein